MRLKCIISLTAIILLLNARAQTQVIRAGVDLMGISSMPIASAIHPTRTLDFRLYGMGRYERDFLFVELGLGHDSRKSDSTFTNVANYASKSSYVRLSAGFITNTDSRTCFFAGIGTSINQQQERGLVVVGNGFFNGYQESFTHKRRPLLTHFQWGVNHEIFENARLEFSFLTSHGKIKGASPIDRVIAVPGGGYNLRARQGVAFSVTSFLKFVYSFPL